MIKIGITRDCSGIRIRALYGKNWQINGLDLDFDLDLDLGLDLGLGLGFENI